MSTLSNEFKCKMKEEATQRLKIWGVLEDPVVKQFQEKNLVFYSERANDTFDGMLYWLSNEKEWVRKVKEIEDEYDVLVYHACHYFTSFGEILFLLCVTADEEMWKEEQEGIQDGYCFGYAINLSYPECSEFGSAMFREKNGGLSPM